MLPIARNISGNDYQIIIVDDASSDDSREIICQIIDENENVQLVPHLVNKGIGQAILSVHKNAEKENLCVISGDGETNVEELLECPKVDPSTFVSFYRTSKPSYTNYRKFLSYMNRIFNRWVLGINLKDVNWTKVYKTEDVQHLQLDLTSALVESEICFKLIRKGIELHELPSKYLDRISGVSGGGSFQTLRRVFPEIIKLILLALKARITKV